MEGWLQRDSSCYAETVAELWSDNVKKRISKFVHFWDDVGVNSAPCTTCSCGDPWCATCSASAVWASERWIVLRSSVHITMTKMESLRQAGSVALSIGALVDTQSVSCPWCQFRRNYRRELKITLLLTWVCRIIVDTIHSAGSMAWHS